MAAAAVVLSWDIGLRNLNYCLMTLGEPPPPPPPPQTTPDAATACAQHAHDYRILAHETIYLGDGAATLALLRRNLVCALRERPHIWDACPPHTIVVVEQQICRHRATTAGGGGAVPSQSFRNQAVQQMIAVLYESKLGHSTTTRQARYKFGGACVAHHTAHCAAQLLAAAKPGAATVPMLAAAAAAGKTPGSGMPYRMLKRWAVVLFNHILPVGSPGRLAAVPADAAPDFADSALQAVRELNEARTDNDDGGGDAAAAAAAVAPGCRRRRRRVVVPLVPGADTTTPAPKKRKKRRGSTAVPAGCAQPQQDRGPPGGA